MKKTALVESGGGMAACYIAGATYAISKNFNSFKPDMVIGGSGSTGTLSYYVAGQTESIKNIWLNLLCNKKFINPFRFWRVIDIDYLIDVVFKKEDTLAEENIYQSNIEYLISTTNHKTRKLEYFSNKKKENVFESMRASMAMPVAFNKYIRINHKEYCDTIVSASVKLNIEQALKLGAEKIIVVSVDDLHTSKFTDFFYNMWLKVQSKKFLKNYQKEEAETYVIPENVKILRIEPRKKLSIGTLGNTRELLARTFAHGYRDVLRNELLREFLLSD
ncbi:MAG: patatin-like phospholipase family protein [Candidatus Paceibacterota bacterium]|jgi:predicted patatin/cPLA2 family phospholipase